MDKGLSFLSATASLRTAIGLSAFMVASQATPSQATVMPIALPAFVNGVSGCAMSVQPLSPASAPAASLTKSAAVLGGAPSALDAIRAQQQVALSPAAAPQTTLLAEAAAGFPVLTPGVDASVTPQVPCTGLAAARIAPIPGSGAERFSLSKNPDNFLASKRVRIAHTSFDKDWKRVRGETVSASQLRRYLGAVPASRIDSLGTVNRWVNRHIAYREDRDQYGVADYWAGARRTLKSGKGDCEDIALTKMQLLAASGVPREDMILTIARDLVRNADHAVLIVRTDAGWRMLDNATDDVLDAAPNHDYRAILSFGSQTSWLHGV